MEKKCICSVLRLPHSGHLGLNGDEKGAGVPNSISRKLLFVTYTKLDFYDILTLAHYLDVHNVSNGT